jgi:hypothetical protein
MKYQNHPDFARWFEGFFMRAWVLLVILFGGSYYLVSHDLDWGWEFWAAFMVGGIGVMGYVFYRVYHVPCPECTGKTQTIKDLERWQWTAYCKRCDITWDLGIGLGGGSD